MDFIWSVDSSTLYTATSSNRPIKPAHDPELPIANGAEFLIFQPGVLFVATISPSTYTFETPVRLSNVVWQIERRRVRDADDGRTAGHECGADLAGREGGPVLQNAIVKPKLIVSVVFTPPPADHSAWWRNARPPCRSCKIRRERHPA